MVMDSIASDRARVACESDRVATAKGQVASFRDLAAHGAENLRVQMTGSPAGGTASLPRLLAWPPPMRWPVYI
jgi:hypothetical protein